MTGQITLILPFFLAACSPSESQNAANIKGDNSLVGMQPDDRDAVKPKLVAADASAAENDPIKMERKTELPNFDTHAYCASIGEVAGGSYEIEKTCRAMESEALSKLQSRSIPDRVLNYCATIGKTAQGSYQIMNTCVDMELEAADSL